MSKTLAWCAAGTIAAAVLVACGGGSTPAATTSATAQSVTMQTIITDNLATDYSKVWVTIKKITAVDSSGNEVTLFDGSTTPAVVNLSSLASVGQFMASVTIPAGIYTEVRVTLDNAVQLVSLDGSTTTNAQFASNGGDYVWHIRSVSLDASTSGQVVLDFNLAKFTYDPATGLVTPVVELPRVSDAIKKFVRSEAEIEGSIASVDTTAGTFTVNDPHLGNGVIVQPSANAVIVDEESGATLTLAQLGAGTHVEIKGVVTPGATAADPITVQATVVKVEPSSDAQAAQRVKGEGTVTAVNGNLVTVNLQEASFLPGSNSVTVDVSAATFTHGQLADVSVGVQVEFKGTVSGSGSSVTVAARLFDVVGAPSTQDMHDHGDRFAELHGTVAAVNAGGSFTVTASQSSEHVAAGTYTVDPSHALFVAGEASCLAVGETVEAVGSLSSTTLSANIVAIDGGCANPTPPSPPASAASGS